MTVADHFPLLHNSAGSVLQCLVENFFEIDRNEFWISTDIWFTYFQNGTVYRMRLQCDRLLATLNNIQMKERGEGATEYCAKSFIQMFIISE